MAQDMSILMKDLDVKKCAYCGAPASDREHMVPYSFLFPGKRRNSKKILGMEWNIVWACRECNIIAGKKVFGTFEEKREYICEQVERRYKKILNLPAWDEDELRDLTGKLNVMVFMSLKAQELIKLRLDNLRYGEIPTHLGVCKASQGDETDLL